MNPLDDHELLLWAMRAGLTRDEVRQAVRQGLDAGRIPWQSARETPQQRLERLQVVQDYLQDQYLAGYQDSLANLGPGEEAMAPWQWRQLPAHARSRYAQSLPLDKAPRDEHGRLAAGPDWVHRKGQQRLFNIQAITEGSFMGREGDELVSTWDPSKVMKRIQMLGAHE